MSGMGISSVEVSGSTTRQQPVKHKVMLQSMCSKYTSTSKTGMGTTIKHKKIRDYSTGWTIGVQLPMGTMMGSFSSSLHPNWVWGPPSLLFNGY